MFVIGPVLGGTVAEQWAYAVAFTVAGLVTAMVLLWIVLPGGSESNHAKPPPPRVAVWPAP
jgi:predicted MFS family arabinose efflux permease